MSRALTARQIARSCASLLRSSPAAESHVPPSQCHHFPVFNLCEQDVTWLPSCFVRGSFASSTAHQRGFATGSGGESPTPPSKKTSGSKTTTRSPSGRNTSASAADSKQQRAPRQNTSAGGSNSAASTSSAQNEESRRSRQSSAPLQGGAGAETSSASSSQGIEGPLSPGQGSGLSDGGSSGSSLSVVVPGRELEGNIDDLLDAWDPLMAEEDLSMDAIFEVLERHLGDGVRGLPSPQAILDAGDVDELREKELRRKREEALKEEFAAKRIRVVDEFGRSYATGKRKCSIARVWVMPGTGKIRVNRRNMTEYFPALVRRMDVIKPFEVSGTLGHFDVMSTVKGGGSTGQAQALRHGIARALQLFNPALRSVLKTEGLLTRDSRVVERKKPGLAKARKAFQWVKR